MRVQSALVLCGAVLLAGCFGGSSSDGDNVHRVTSFTPVGSELPDPGPPPSYASSAECLTAKGAVLYGAAWCPYTRQQKESFGSSFRYIQYVECTEQESLCDKRGIRAYPTWIIDGKRVEGYTAPAELYSMVRCD